jgi:hypothetical protein
MVLVGTGIMIFFVTGLIDPKDNEATGKKAEQLALDSSLALVHYPTIGADCYTLPRATV